MKKQGAKVAKLASGDQMLDYSAWNGRDHHAWARGYSHCRQSPYNQMCAGYGANPYRNLRHADGAFPYTRDLADSSYYSAAAAMANTSPRNRLAAKIDQLSYSRASAARPSKKTGMYGYRQGATVEELN